MIYNQLELNLFYLLINKTVIKVDEWIKDETDIKCHINNYLN